MSTYHFHMTYCVNPRVKQSRVCGDILNSVIYTVEKHTMLYIVAYREGATDTFTVVEDARKFLGTFQVYEDFFGGLSVRGIEEDKLKVYLRTRSNEEEEIEVALDWLEEELIEAERPVWHNVNAVLRGIYPEIVNYLGMVANTHHATFVFESDEVFYEFMENLEFDVDFVY